MWYKSCQHTLGYYVDILARLQYNIEDSNATSKKKRARQTARSVLPNCTETKIVVTGNLRAWRHFIHLRGSMYADTEIRKIAMHVAAILHELAPDVFFDIQGSPFEVTLEEGSI
jgi:thymidylate synthase (FAD)